jgi:hypothetical protein
VGGLGVFYHVAWVGGARPGGFGWGVPILW